MNLDFYGVIRDISVNQHYANRYVKMMCHYQSLRLKKGERHHVLPRSLFPDYKYKRGNIVCLPYRVHFIAHMLLWLATRHEKMAMALNMMGNFRFKSRSYERYRTRVVAQIGQNARGRRWFNNPDTGETIFVYPEDAPDGFVAGQGQSVSDATSQRTSGMLFWYSPSSGEVTRAKERPEGDWINSRGPKFDGFAKINDGIKVFDLKSKKKYTMPHGSALEAWHFPCHGGRDDDKFVFVKGGSVYMTSTICLPNQYRIRYKQDLSDYVVPAIRKSSRSEPKTLEYCQLNAGKTVSQLGFEIYKLKDFEWKEWYVKGTPITRPTRNVKEQEETLRKFGFIA